MTAISVPLLSCESTFCHRVGGTELKEWWGTSDSIHVHVQPHAGEIPPSLGQLRSLQQLDLSSNLLSGEPLKQVGGCGTSGNTRTPGDRINSLIPYGTVSGERDAVVEPVRKLHVT